MYHVGGESAVHCFWWLALSLLLVHCKATSFDSSWLLLWLRHPGVISSSQTRWLLLMLCGESRPGRLEKGVFYGGALSRDDGKGGSSVRGVASMMFDGVGGSGEHLALLFLVLQNTVPRDDRGCFEIGEI